jgi:hypothetical protein
MPKHLRIDPHDPYAQHEVSVEFERIGSCFRVAAVIADDILADLVKAQRDDPRRKLAEADRTSFGLALLSMTRHDPMPQCFH